jgi:hypothetical protein
MRQNCVCTASNTRCENGLGIGATRHSQEGEIVSGISARDIDRMPLLQRGVDLSVIALWLGARS